MAAALASARTAHGQDYEVDLDGLEKKPFSFGGFVEAEPILHVNDLDAALYQLRTTNADPGRASGEIGLGSRLEGHFEKGPVYLGGRREGGLGWDHLGWNAQLDLQEGCLSFNPSVSFGLDAGKLVNKWGTGYFRNPVSFVDRPKDPEDPQEALEGFYGARAELIKSFTGPLQTLALTPVLLPVTEHVNADYGQAGHLNVAARLYLLLWDTDTDLVVLGGASRPHALGLDLARNITSNFEVHGETAWFVDFGQGAASAGDGLEPIRSAENESLVGLRYLNRHLTTFIVEYYHQGGGLRRDEAASFYQEVREAAADDDPTALEELEAAAGDSIGTSLPMTDYLYLRIFQKEPLGLIHLTPGISSIVNLIDRSFLLIPELQYSPVTNLTLRLRAAGMVGRRDSDFGEKRDDYRFELRGRFFF